MQREIKFEYVGLNIATRDIWRQILTLEQIQEGREIYTFFTLDNTNCKMLARRQYTGLTDKNGVEIYEGDIVRQHDPYRSSQTHTGNNIPMGSYTEPMEPEISNSVTPVVYSNGAFILGEPKELIDPEDAFNVTFLSWAFVSYDLKQAQEGFSGGWSEYGKNGRYTWYDPDEGDLQYLMYEYDLVDEDALLNYLGLEVMGNIYENPELLS